MHTPDAIADRMTGPYPLAAWAAFRSFRWLSERFRHRRSERYVYNFRSPTT
jgi:hypothetical protein